MNVITLYRATLNDPEKKAYENIVGKGENAGITCTHVVSSIFSFSQNVFHLIKEKLCFEKHLSASNAFNLDKAGVS